MLIKKQEVLEDRAITASRSLGLDGLGEIVGVQAFHDIPRMLCSISVIRYEEYVPIADQLFHDHLKQIERDEKKREEKKRGKEFP